MGEHSGARNSRRALTTIVVARRDALRRSYTLCESWVCGLKFATRDRLLCSGQRLMFTKAGLDFQRLNLLGQ